MRLQKPSAENPVKPARDVLPKAPPVKTPQKISLQPPVTRSVPLGLPADKLTASIVSFARFFSLPLQPELLSAIRRQSFALQSPESPPQVPPPPKEPRMSPAVPPVSADANSHRIPLSLAAAAAAGKGVELSPEGLAVYAAAIDPDRQEKRHSQERGRREKQDEEDPRKGKSITGAKLKETALAAAESDPLLSLMNMLPDSGGRRWIVFPFDYERQFRVSFRVLLENDETVNLMVLDIAENNQESRRTFVMKAANACGNNTQLIEKLTVYVRPELSKGTLASVERELSRLLELKRGSISVKDREEAFPCETSGEDEPPVSINEEA